MSIQIAVRLPEDVVAFVDGLVAQGRAASRAEVVSRALARERRLAAAGLDLERLTAARITGREDDLDDLVAWSSANPTDPDVG